MFYCSQQHWPVVLFEFQAEQSQQDHQVFLDIWDELFQRQEPFIVLRVYHDETALIHSPSVGKLTRQWLKDGADEKIKQHVNAMIHIVPEAAYPKMQHMSVEKVFGVPGGIFSATEDAIAWFNQQPLDLGITLNIDYFAQGKTD